jgi:hypothetical protein
MENAKWRTFSDADYQTLFADVQGGKYTISSDHEAAIADLGLKLVKVTEVTD